MIAIFNISCTMNKNNILLLILIFVFQFGFAQEEKKSLEDRVSKLSFGAGINVPFKPNSAQYNVGLSLNERYEFLFLEHFSIVQEISFNFISGQTVDEFYVDRVVSVEYENFYTVPFQFGLGYYFGMNQTGFFVLVKGGIAYYKGVDPAYPEIKVNGNVVRPAIPRTENDGWYHFISPTIGWQWKRWQASASYQGHVEGDAILNILNMSFAYRVY